MRDRTFSDRRWVILAEDGRYVTLGRATDPSEDEIHRAEQGLRAAGMGGWLAVLGGGAHAKRKPEVMQVRPLAEPTGTFEAAVRAFRRATPGA